jgi:PAS domain S-box-containing protein
VDVRGDSDVRDASGQPRAEHVIAPTLSESADPSGVYRAVLGAIGDSLGWDFGAAWEETPDGERLRCVDVWEAPEAGTDRFRVLTERITFGRGEGLPGRVWATGEPVWIAELAGDSNFPRADAAATAGLRSAFCFPVSIEGRVVGVIEFYGADPAETDAELLESMTVLGSQVGRLVGRRRAEDRLHAGEALNRAIFSSALDAVVAMDHSGRVLEFNPAAERIFGYRREQALGQDMAELIVPPSLRAQHRRGFARYLETEQPVVLDQRLEITGMRHDGSEFPVELTITRIGLGGRPTFTGFLRDITDRKAAEEELRASRARLVETADAERRRIERNLHDGAQQRLVALALRLRRVRETVPAVAGSTRRELDAIELELALALEELRELANGIHPAVLAERGLGAAVTVLARRAPMQVDVGHVPERRLPEGIEAAAYYVAAEALTNAAKHAAAGTVRVELSERDGMLEVVVEDDGVGGASLAAGTGLRGLADRVEAAGGRLEVESPVGIGTRLRAELPLEEPGSRPPGADG